MTSVENLLAQLQADDFIRSHIVHQETLVAHPGTWGEFPAAMLARQC